MVKYRRLTQLELEELEKDFVNFLSAQSITADDWIAIKNKDGIEMNKLIDQFSDIVLEKVLSNISYLEMLSSQEIRIFKTEDSKARLLGIRIVNTELDLRNEDDLAQLFKNTSELIKHKAELFHLEKEYSKAKADEVFFLVKNGAMICDNKLYDVIDSLLKEEN